MRSATRCMTLGSLLSLARRRRDRLPWNRCGAVSGARRGQDFALRNHFQIAAARCLATDAAGTHAGDTSSKEDQELDKQDEGPSPRNFPFGLQFQDCPHRLEYVPKELVDDQTQIFYAMVNDTDRNDFYWHALQACDLHGKMVLDIGTGSGILAMMAAKLGARRVVTIEECPDLARLAKRNIAANGFADVIEVIHGLSTEISLDERADVLVTETMGTWMTCEGMVQWCEDARKRLLKEDAQFVPRRGTQYAVLVESDQLERLFTCWRPYRGIDLSAMMELQDTVSMQWSKRVGLKPSDLVYRELCTPFPLLEIDFASTRFSDLPRKRETNLTVRAGRIHAVLDFFVVEDAQGRHLSTDPRARRCEPWAYARDIAWGNGFQLVTEESASATDSSKDPRWIRFPDVDVPSTGLVMDGSDLRLCKCGCIYYGHAGFVVADGRAQFRSGSREELMDVRNHVTAPGCELYVIAATGADDPVDGSRVVLKPFDVVDCDRVSVVSSFDENQRSAQHFVARQ